MEQEQLFVVPDRFDIRVRLCENGYWSLTIDRYVLGRSWRMSDRETYEGLSLAEVTDALLQELYGVRP